MTHERADLDGTRGPTIGRRVAYLLAFSTSAAVLVLEIVAGRLLAPYVGVTLQTYTAIIGVVLAGIAGGTWLGGRLADRHDPRRVLGMVVALGGLLTLLAVPLVRSVAVHAARHGVPGVIGLTALGFFAPCAVLSTISPLLAKISLRSLDSTGRTVGTLSALSTTGAILGTFVTGFVLEAALPTTAIILVLGGALLLLGLVLIVLVARQLGTGGVGSTRALALLLVLGASATVGELRVRSACEIESAYFCASVLTDPSRPDGRILHLDNLDHSYVALDDPAHLEFAYTQMFAIAVDTMTSGPIDAVHLGGGGFTMPRYLRATRPGSTGVVLERDRLLPDLVRRRLGWTPGSDVRVVTGDGRVTLAALSSGSADVLFGDAFGAEAVPWHLTTRELTRQVHRVLRPGGLYVLNAIDSGRDAFARAEVRTIRTVFRHVVVLAPTWAIEEGYGANFVVVASDRPIDVRGLRRGIAQRGTDAIVLHGGSLRRWVGNVPVLTDDHAPVDQLFTPS